jgi:hypothetical protein
MSARASARPARCSGAMYAGVPEDDPVRVSRSEGATSASDPPDAPGSSSPPPRRASPKSVTHTRPSSATRTLSGLKSRCTSPAACGRRQPPSGLQEHVEHLAPPSRALGEPRPHVPSVDEVHGDEDAVTARADASWMAMTLGWTSLAMARASRISRSRRSSASSALASGWMSLSATSRSRSGSRAA